MIEGWGQDLKLTSVYICELVRLNGHRLFFVHDYWLLLFVWILRVRDPGIVLSGDPGRDGVPCHLDRQLLGHSRAWGSGLDGTPEHCSSMDLTEFGLVVAGMRVDIVRLHILPVDASSARWLRVSVSVGAKSWFSKEGRQS